MLPSHAATSPDVIDRAVAADPDAPGDVFADHIFRPVRPRIFDRVENSRVGLARLS